MAATCSAGDEHWGHFVLIKHASVNILVQVPWCTHARIPLRTFLLKVLGEGPPALLQLAHLWLCCAWLVHSLYDRSLTCIQ